MSKLSLALTELSRINQKLVATLTAAMARPGSPPTAVSKFEATPTAVKRAAVVVATPAMLANVI